jgi:PhnB protein
MEIQPYLSFDGRCEEAIEFYRKAVGAEVIGLMRWKDHPEPASPSTLPPGSENKVMHAALRIGESTVMASDGRNGGKPVFQGVSLAIRVPTEADAERAFTALVDGGTVGMPLGKTFFSPRFGTLTDRFGVEWMVVADQK